MSLSPKSPEHDAADAGEHDDTRDVNKDRRKAMRQIGYAAAVAPAMLVLMNGRSEAVPSCDNPAWQNGVSRRGHSGC